MRVLALVGRGGAVAAAAALGETCALALVRPEGEAALVAAAASGARRLVALWDDALAGTDYLGVAQVLVAAARHIGFDLIVTGCRGGALGPAMAERLAIPHLTGVASATVENGRLVARRWADRAWRRYAAQPPLLIALDAAGTASPTSTAAAPTVERLTLADVKLTAAELAWRRRFLPRPATAPPALALSFADAPSLVARLRADGILPPLASGKGGASG